MRCYRRLLWGQTDFLGGEKKQETSVNNNLTHIEPFIRTALWIMTSKVLYSKESKLRTTNIYRNRKLQSQTINYLISHQWWGMYAKFEKYTLQNWTSLRVIIIKCITIKNVFYYYNNYAFLHCNNSSVKVVIQSLSYHQPECQQYNDKFHYAERNST